MFASKDLKPGELILRESSTIIGPGRQSYPVCVGWPNWPDGESYCQNCGWQLCSPECQESKNHRDECKVLTDNGVECTIEDFNDTTLAMDFMGGLRVLLAIKGEYF